MTFAKDITIIIPTYKRPEDIARALGTAVLQKTGDYSLEIILYPHMQPLFSRTGDFPEGHIDKTFGTGGCLIDRGRCRLPVPVFDPSLNETGGEDDVMFAYILAQGASIGWTHTAIAVEHIPPHRSTPSYVWKRNFAFGQGPSQTAADDGVKGIPGVIKWMGVGVVQCVLYGVQYAMRRTIGRADYIKSYARLSQGIGKVLWFSGFSPRLYGGTALYRHGQTPVCRQSPSQIGPVSHANIHARGVYGLIDPLLSQTSGTQ